MSILDFILFIIIALGIFWMAPYLFHVISRIMNLFKHGKFFKFYN